VRESRIAFGWMLGQAALLLLVSGAGAVSLHFLSHTYSWIQIQSAGQTTWLVLGAAAAGLFLYRSLLQRQALLAGRRRALAKLEQERARTRVQELTSLFKVAASLNMSLELHELLDLAAQRLASALTAQQVSLMLLDEASGELRTAAAYGVEAEFARRGCQKLGTGIAGVVAESKEARLFSGPASGTGENRNDGVRNISSAMCVPVLAGEDCVGVLNINRISYPDDFTPHHLKMAETFGEHLGGLITQIRSVKSLAKRTSELETDLEFTSDRVREIDRLRDLFLSTASHELRTPVTVILGAVDLLESLDRGEMTEEMFWSIIKDIRDGCGRVAGVVDDMIELANIEEGRVVLHMQQTSLNDLIRSAVDSLRPVAARYEIPIEEQYDVTLPSVELDRIKLRHPLVQLLAYALQFTEEGKGILVRTFQEGECLMVEIRDGGGVMEGSDAEQMLRLFGQGILKARRNLTTGGVGLNLLKLMVELHGGRLEARSHEGSGVAYRIRIPKASDHLTIVSTAA